MCKLCYARYTYLSNLLERAAFHQRNNKQTNELGQILRNWLEKLIRGSAICFPLHLLITKNQFLIFITYILVLSEFIEKICA